MDRQSGGPSSKISLGKRSNTTGTPIQKIILAMRIFDLLMLFGKEKAGVGKNPAPAFLFCKL
jgi:hypothetical protein